MHFLAHDKRPKKCFMPLYAMPAYALVTFVVVKIWGGEQCINLNLQVATSSC